jgi:hypothetical protein
MICHNQRVAGLWSKDYTILSEFAKFRSTPTLMRLSGKRPQFWAIFRLISSLKHSISAIAAGLADCVPILALLYPGALGGQLTLEEKVHQTTASER